MKNSLTTLLFLLVLQLGFSQNAKELTGTWKFQTVTSTNPSCKGVDYFPVQSFTFLDNGNAVFESDEGTAGASFRLNGNIIELYNLSENGVKQEGELQFIIKELSKKSLILVVEYDCGSIDIIFNK